MASGMRYKRNCSYCVDKISHVGVEDIALLKRIIGDNGKIIPQRISGTCALHQRRVSVAIKNARQLGYLPYIVDYV